MLFYPTCHTHTLLCCQEMSSCLISPCNAMLWLPSVLWHCWLGVRKSIRPVKNWVMRCWRGYLSAARCKWFAYGPPDATATPSSLASLKSGLVWPFWYWVTHVVLEKRQLNECLSVMPSSCSCNKCINWQHETSNLFCRHKLDLNVLSLWRLQRSCWRNYFKRAGSRLFRSKLSS